MKKTEGKRGRHEAVKRERNFGSPKESDPSVNSEGRKEEFLGEWSE